ncbi:response regulator [Desulfopila inferna]|uniref:response regulator n=1 Tax=Desulfopila inferna TaxID=468528 RepID=UPI001963DBAB|nr:response regulator transcription factor [Desulfopila inferna]MBM9604129.1 response regulator transcription factor [Desulfopila inferna]
MKFEKVLLADCHHDMLGGVRTLLEGIFERVHMVADEASLLEAIEKIRPDLVIADLSFPVTRGLNVIHRLRRLFPEVKLLVLSVHNGQVAMQDSFAAGAVGFVLKSTAVDDLVQAIEAVHQGKRFKSPSLTDNDGQ